MRQTKPKYFKSFKAFRIRFVSNYDIFVNAPLFVLSIELVGHMSLPL